MQMGGLQGGSLAYAGFGLGKGTLEGTCTTMCPAAEEAFRERMRDIDPFERAVEGGPPVLAVKKFARNVSAHGANHSFC